jgi:AraC-like DNA-binding protein
VSETIWMFSSWHSKPQEYRVVSRTARQVKAGRTESAHTHTVRLAEVGRGQWFWSEHDALAYRCKNLAEQIERAKYSLQKLRTELGMAESELKTLLVAKS